MSTMWRRLLVFAALVIIIVVGLRLFRSGTHGGSHAGESAGGVRQSGGNLPPETRSKSKQDDASSSADRFETRVKTEVSSLLQRAVEIFRRGDASEIATILKEMDRMLSEKGTGANESIAAIMEFLRSGVDAPTGQGFVVGEGGSLSEAVTLRVYLMDKLGTLCLETGRSEALDVGRETLDGFGSPDEWAIAMRNVAWLDPGSRTYLAEKVAAMLGNEPWLAQPSTGMLEAFDVVVHAKVLPVVPELGTMLAMDDSPLSRAAAVALNRLAASEPLEFISLLNHDPAVLAESPMERADLVALTDLSNVDQRAAVEAYLLRGDVTDLEKKQFFGSLLQNGQFVSNNLITPLVPPESEEQAVKRLESVSSAVDTWARDARFAVYRDQLAELKSTIGSIRIEMEADGESK